MLPKLPVPSALAYILVISVNSAKFCLNIKCVFALPFRQWPPFCFCLSCQQLSPDWLWLSFYCFLSQSEHTCNLHRCYTILNPCSVLCTGVTQKMHSFLANQNQVIFVCILLDTKYHCSGSLPRVQNIPIENFSLYTSE